MALAVGGWLPLWRLGGRARGAVAGVFGAKQYLLEREHTHALKQACSAESNNRRAQV